MLPTAFSVFESRHGIYFELCDPDNVSECPTPGKGTTTKFKTSQSRRGVSCGHEALQEWLEHAGRPSDEVTRPVQIITQGSASEP